MAFDFNGGFSTMTIREPSKPLKLSGPDATGMYLHEGENSEEYRSFLDVVSNLSQMFKFLPKYEQMKYQFYKPELSSDQAVRDEYAAALDEFDWSGDEIFGDFSKQIDPNNPEMIWGQGEGQGYKNLEFSPGASDWDLVNIMDSDIEKGVTELDTGSASIFESINSCLKSWDKIKTIGGGQSYYQIAKSGVIESWSDEDAFNLMCSMVESRERVFDALGRIFLDDEYGDPAILQDDPNVIIDNISAWLGDYMDVDPHNMCSLRMFFGMQTDFINTLDAYMNCDTYWGGDLETPGETSDLGGFGHRLIEKAESYIATLTGDQKAAAEELETLWLTQSPRWDKEGDSWTGEVVKTEGSWSNFFFNTMENFHNEEIIRVIICNIMNRRENQKYKTDKAEYEDKKEQAILDDIHTQRIAAKNAAESKKSMKKLLARRTKVSKAIRPKAKSRPVVSRAKTARPAKIRVAPKPMVRQAPVVVAAAVAKAKPAPKPSVQNVAHPSQKAHNQSNKKNEKKVI